MQHNTIRLQPRYFVRRSIKNKVTTVFSNYEKVGDVVLCKQMEMRLPGMKQIIEFEKIQLNQELPKDWEKLPKAISSQLR